ncbi:CesD/SycD/LcrH family type III secretion system chaperone [Parashewanella tropica]|uniref:CesD/SycD/LcrH family type III secretion system chaperone n=1 Tax=Parashewanella tropica TaxID=2547970 RepID=UPI001059DE49|nr:CesD/SycD/LcrH family type III secretion system chaperone [Parashewanella tropica]
MKQRDPDWEVDIKQLEEACRLALVEHKTLAEAKGMTPQELEDVYAKGLEKYHAEKPEEALADFSYLVMHQPYDRRFHMALGSTFHWLGEFKHAMNFYGYALLMDACDPGATFRIAQCFLSLGDEASAIDALQTAISQSFTKPEHYEVGQHARKLLEEINK